MGKKTVKMQMRCSIAIALVLTVGLAAAYATGIPLPTTPPPVEGEPFSQSEQLPEDSPTGRNATAPMPEADSSEGLPEVISDQAPTKVAKNVSGKLPLDTVTVLLLGAVIWYFVVLVGITGGRRGNKLAVPHHRQ